MFRVSSFDTEPREFRQWLVESTGDRRMRIDLPATPISQVQPKSVYGVCQPIKSMPSCTESQPPGLSEVEKQSRLVRLLEKQQEWYDAREQARVRAEYYLDIIDQHQKQWLNQQPSTPLENS
ncbi:MAG: hypothetical protein MUC43_00630 [Pirellula sp.]|nr:hypothetical protein [Pirellula sp.]